MCDWFPMLLLLFLSHQIEAAVRY
ncbi:hypothetical protein LINPERPRIM_LOCUS41151 [Linum perenne]